MKSPFKRYTVHQLLFAERARCNQCGSGLAYPLNTKEAMQMGAWVCSKVLLEGAPMDEHEAYPFAFYKIREETSINGAPGQTTRPPGTVAMTQGEATCPKCGTWWEGPAYHAQGLGHHWFSGPCPSCGYDVGGAGSYSSSDGKPIETRYKTVVVTPPAEEGGST